MNKEIFKKKLKHGDLYCDKHDEMKVSASIVEIAWDTGKFDSKLILVCPSCKQD